MRQISDGQLDAAIVLFKIAITLAIIYLWKSISKTISADALFLSRQQVSY